MDEWGELAKAEGLGGLAYIRVQEDGAWKSPIVKFFSEAESEGLRQALDIRPGDLVLFGAGERDRVNTTLGRIRLLAGKLADAMLAETDRFLKAQLGTARPKLADITQATVSYVPDDVASVPRLVLYRAIPGWTGGAEMQFGRQTELGIPISLICLRDSSARILQIGRVADLPIP